TRSEPRLIPEAVLGAEGSTVLRRFAGPEADDLAILLRPSVGESHDAASLSCAAYGALAETLAAERATFRDLASETLLLRDIRRDLPRVLDVRARLLAGLGQAGDAPLPTFIEQAPLDEDAAFELVAAAVIPRDRKTWSVRDVRAAPSCGCEG